MKVFRSNNSFNTYIKYLPIFLIVSILVYYLFFSKNAVYKVRRSGFTTSPPVGGGQLANTIQTYAKQNGLQPSKSRNCYTNCSVVTQKGEAACNSACINNSNVGCIWNPHPPPDYTGYQPAARCETKF
jgi:hypothetical protein